MSLTKITYSMIEGAPVSPLDFGAVGNGIVDDSAALQAAANTGLPIILSDKVYFISTTITITNDLIGPGEITADTGGAATLIAVDADDVSIVNCTLTGNSANAATAANIAVTAENHSGLRIENCKITNGRIRNRNTQLAYVYNFWLLNNDIQADFTLNDYINVQNDIVTVRGINGVWIENNRITFTNCHRVFKLADTEAWTTSDPVTVYRTQNVSFCGNVITGTTGSNKQVVDMFSGVSNAVLSGNNIEVTGFSRVFENKTDSWAQPWNQNITVSDNVLSNDGLVLNFAGTYGDSDPTVDVGWQNLVISNNTIICSAIAATTAIIIRWQHDLVFEGNQIITPAANALLVGANAVIIYGNRFCTFTDNNIKYGNALFATISTGGDRPHAPVMISINAANNTVEEFGSTAATTGRGGLMFASLNTAETADLSVNINGNAIYKSTSPVLSVAGAICFQNCTIAKALVGGNLAKFATASEERVTFSVSTITSFYAENNSWDFYGTVASAGTVSVPGAQIIEVTGTTNITTINAANNAGRRITLVFRDVLTVTDGSNLKLNGNFVTSADDTLTLVCDGTNWYETSRSAN
jgi:hypothetical protein